MSNTVNTIELPADLQSFAEELVRSGKSTSVAEVVREALEQKKRAVSGEALDARITDLDDGHGMDTSPEDLMADIYADVSLPP